MTRKLFIQLPDSIVCFSQVDRGMNTWREIESSVCLIDDEVCICNDMHNHEIQFNEAEDRVMMYIEKGGRLIMHSIPS